MKQILEQLHSCGKFVAVASRTYEPAWARQLLHLLDIDPYFHAKENYPSSRVRHLERIQSHFKVPYFKMVFFDDEYRNTAEVGKLGVQAVYVENGIKAAQVAEFLR